MRTAHEINNAPRSQSMRRRDWQGAPTGVSCAGPAAGGGRHHVVGWRRVALVGACSFCPAAAHKNSGRIFSRSERLPANQRRLPTAIIRWRSQPARRVSAAAVVESWCHRPRRPLGLCWRRHCGSRPCPRCACVGLNPCAQRRYSRLADAPSVPDCASCGCPPRPPASAHAPSRRPSAAATLDRARRTRAFAGRVRAAPRTSGAPSTTGGLSDNATTRSSHCCIPLPLSTTRSGLRLSSLYQVPGTPAPRHPVLPPDTVSPLSA